MVIPVRVRRRPAILSPVEAKVGQSNWQSAETQCLDCR